MVCSEPIQLASSAVSAAGRLTGRVVFSLPSHSSSSSTTGKRSLGVAGGGLPTRVCSVPIQFPSSAFIVSEGLAGSGLGSARVGGWATGVAGGAAGTGVAAGGAAPAGDATGSAVGTGVATGGGPGGPSGLAVGSAVGGLGPPVRRMGMVGSVGTATRRGRAGCSGGCGPPGAPGPGGAGVLSSAEGMAALLADLGLGRVAVRHRHSSGRGAAEKRQAMPSAPANPLLVSLSVTPPPERLAVVIR